MSHTETVDALNAFRVSEPAQIAQYLHAVQERDLTVQLSGSDGVMLSTRLWQVDESPSRLAFAVDVRDPAVQQLVAADEAVAICYLDQVRIEFDLQQRLLVHGDHQSLLQCEAPRDLLRFQRRGAYRVRTIDSSGPLARMRHPALADMQLVLRVLDVSAGGLALLLPADAPTVEPGIIVSGVRVDLDSGTVFSASLQIHHVTVLDPASQGVRLGCEFVNLGSDDQRMLQRYINHTQKRRRMLALD